MRVLSFVVGITIFCLSVVKADLQPVQRSGPKPIQKVQILQTAGAREDVKLPPSGREYKMMTACCWCGMCVEEPAGEKGKQDFNFNLRDSINPGSGLEEELRLMVEEQRMARMRAANHDGPGSPHSRFDPRFIRRSNFPHRGHPIMSDDMRFLHRDV